MEKKSSHFKAHCIKVCFEINLSHFFGTLICMVSLLKIPETEKML